MPPIEFLLRIPVRKIKIRSNAPIIGYALRLFYYSPEKNATVVTNFNAFKYYVVIEISIRRKK